MTRAFDAKLVQAGISTHTLTWSVTAAETSQYSSFVISTHTLTWSVTPRSAEQAKKPTNFNSHAHVERDTSDLVVIAIFEISTHTLTWSVT